MELRFTVWQFVRLMVHLEDNAPLPKDQQSLTDDWGDVWASLDADLARLAEEDFDAYSALMMDEDVVIEAATPAQAKAAGDGLAAVMAVIDAKIDQEGDGELLDDLKFERRELRQLSRKFHRLAQTPGEGEG